MESTIPEVPLQHAPLAMVLSQVRFSYTPELVTVHGEQALHEALPQYPVRHRENIAVPVSDSGPASHTVTNCRFSTVDNKWAVTVAADFVAIATVAYRSRSDLLNRLRGCLLAVESVMAPARVDRIGVRYVDRVEDPQDLAVLDEMVRPSLIGWSNISGEDFGAQELSLREESTQALISADGDQIIVRSFRLPAGAGYDPTIPHSEQPSWILDIDAGDLRPTTFSTPALCDSASRLAERCYSAFRWAVTDKFLERYE